jgi:hypothetical protein
MPTEISGTTGVSKVQDGVVVNADIVSVASGKVTGTTTNDDAAAGVVGEYVVSAVASGSGVSLVTSTAKTVTSISLTAGDWDVSGLIGFLPAATTSITALLGCASTTTDTNDLTNSVAHRCSATVPAAVVWQIPTQTTRLSLASTTTVYLVAVAVFTISTITAHGTIHARRVR